MEKKLPIMPKATAIWLIDNTSLTFVQIADFCGLHVIEIQALADDQISPGMIGVNPINIGQVTLEDIKKCEQDPSARLTLNCDFDSIRKTKSKRKYTPLVKRKDRPDAIAWVIKFHPEVSDASICNLLSTTKGTVMLIRAHTHARMSEIRPRDPVLLGFCSQIELDKVIQNAQKNKEIVAG